METTPPASYLRLLLGILALAGILRLVDIDAPLIDGMAIKQIFVAHRARQIAEPPFSLLRNRFDFLSPEGEPSMLAEEIPLFSGIVAAGYSLFGEHEWMGRLLSVIATLIAIAALHDLVRRRGDPQLALAAAFLFSVTPLLLFYGRAFQPDAAMLACMLAAACAYERHLDRPHWARWTLTLTLCALGAAFKYYGLMVLLPLTIATVQRRGWRLRSLVGVGGLAVLACSPVVLWVGVVFARMRNPAQTQPYFIFQMPELLVDSEFYSRLADRFLYKDCGPVLAVLIVLGAVAVIRRRGYPAPPLLGWTAMGILFYFLLGPMLRYHNYYELMMMPGAAMWGAIGWLYFWRRATRMWRGVLLAVMATAAVLHSPWISKADFGRETGLFYLAGRMDAECSERGRFAIAGPYAGAITVHYSHRQGWVWHLPLPEDIDRYHRLGAEFLIIYLNRDVAEGDRATYRRVVDRWPIIEKGIEPWDIRGRQVEYYILDLRPRD